MNFRFPISDLTSTNSVDMRSRRIRRGFSFTEILFAVIILGIGFIMVAAIFPVAIQQAKNTSDESSGAASVFSAASYLSGTFSDVGSPPAAPATDSNCPPDPSQTALTSPIVVQNLRINTPTTPPGTPKAWQIIGGNLIRSEDSRYACICLYSRGISGIGPPLTYSPVAQIYIFPVEARATSTFTANDLFVPAPPSALVANLMGRSVRVAVADDAQIAGGSDLLAFDLRAGGPTAANVDAATQDAFVIIANDQIAGLSAGKMNGRVYKLGARRSDLDGAGNTFGDASWTSGMVVYELNPTNEFARDPGANGQLYNSSTNSSDTDDISAIGNKTAVSNSTVIAPQTADAFVIGRGYADPLNPGAGYSGAAMPTGPYFTTLVKVAQ